MFQGKCTHSSLPLEVNRSRIERTIDPVDPSREHRSHQVCDRAGEGDATPTEVYLPVQTWRWIRLGGGPERFASCDHQPMFRNIAGIGGGMKYCVLTAAARRVAGARAGFEVPAAALVAETIEVAVGGRPLLERGRDGAHSLHPSGWGGWGERLESRELLRQMATARRSPPLLAEAACWR